MSEPKTPYEQLRDQLAAAHEQQAGEAALQRQSIAELRGFIVSLAEDNLRLHRENRALTDALGRDVENMKRQLRRLSSARS